MPVSRHQRPDGMSVEEWQTVLRRQYGQAQAYSVERLGGRSAFADYRVTNPQSRGEYRVIVRGTGPGDNTCSCPDHAVNTLGTCKHIEYLLAWLRRRPSARAELAAGYRPAGGEVYVRYGSQRTVCVRPPHAPGPEYARLIGRFFGTDGVLRPGQAERFDRFVTAAQGMDAGVRVRDDAVAYLAELADADERVRRVDALFPGGVRDPRLAALLKLPLYDYQRTGALFAARAGRCLIADEMGLGKTAQAVAAAEILARAVGVGRVLVVCPTSLKYQWRAEIERFSARPVAVIDGPADARGAAFADPRPFFKVTNYDTVHSDLAAIAGWEPDLLVLDEAQRVKNWGMRTARSVKRVRTPYAVVLTGTPLENRLEELVSVVEVVDPYRLGPTFRLLDTHLVRNPAGQVVGFRDLDAIRAALAPVMIRRRRDEVLDQLPGRIESTVYVPLTGPQRDAHAGFQQTVARLVAKWQRARFLTAGDRKRLLAALQRMRMVCDSTYLVDGTTRSGQKVDEVTTVLDGLLEPAGAKVVVFSEWVRMHELLIRAAKQRRWGHVFFHGEVPAPDRGRLVERFRTDPACRLFFSTAAGATGLNLQAASAVVHVDRPWNPAVLDQRVGRVHRLGQTRPVQVVSVVARGTIEEGMLTLLRFKKGLFAGVLDGGPTDQTLAPGRRRTRFMDDLAELTAAIPPAPPAEVAEAAEARREFQPRPEPLSTPVPAEPADPWVALARAGAALLGAAAAGAGGPRVATDERTGERYLRLPVPPPAVLADLSTLLGQLAVRLRG
ncbi:MAG: DEAD/DEAH box helicase [Gemmataceae bacterium]